MITMLTTVSRCCCYIYIYMCERERESRSCEECKDTFFLMFSYLSTVKYLVMLKNLYIYSSHLPKSNYSTTTTKRRKNNNDQAPPRVLKFLNISTHLALVAFTFNIASSSSREETKHPRNLETNRSGCQRNISERRSLTAHDLE
jgi:hypothetical protein